MVPQRSASPTAGRARLVWLLPVGLTLLALLGVLGYALWARTTAVEQGIGYVTLSALKSGVSLVGRPAPDFTAITFDGQPWRLSDQRGRVVVLNYWASWCVPCREEAPILERVWRDYRDRGVVLLGLNIQDTPEAARAFVREFGLTYPNAPDPTGEITIAYGVLGIPETYLIGRDGRIVDKKVGIVREADLRARLEAALRE